MKKNLTFPSHGVACAAWHIPAVSDVLAGAAGRPCVVMAHGFGGTRDTGLIGYAEGFADHGIDVLVFDYRGFGDSEGTPRQDVSFRRQRQDYHAAIAAARHLPGVDADRIALWGTSYSGGHVIAVAAQDRRVAAIVSMTPATDGLAAAVQIARYAGAGQLVRTTGHGCATSLAGSPGADRTTSRWWHSGERWRSSAPPAPRRPTPPSPARRGGTRSARAQLWRCP